MNIQKSIENFIQNRELAPNTKSNYRQSLSLLVNFIESKNLKTHYIPESNINEFQKFIIGKNFSGKTTQLHFNVIRIYHKSINKPFATNYRVPLKERKRHQKKEVQKYFNTSEIQKIVAHSESVGGRVAVLIALLLETGTRISETASIELSNIDLETGTIWIETSKTVPRHIFISEKTVQKIQEFVFDMPLNQKVLFSVSLDTLKKDVADMLQAVGLKSEKDGRGAHTIRHYTATYLHYVGGLSIMDVAILLGDEESTIKENYIHPTPEMLRPRIRAAWGWE